MAHKAKIKHRLPVGVVQKLSGNAGGGTHQKKKGRGSYSRKKKHRARDEDQNRETNNQNVSHFIKFITWGGGLVECTPLCFQKHGPNMFGIMLLEAGHHATVSISDTAMVWRLS